MNAPADVMWPPCSPDSYRDEEGCSTSLVRFFRSVFYFTILFELFCFACSCSHFACVTLALCLRHAHSLPASCPQLACVVPTLCLSPAHTLPESCPRFAHATPTPAWARCGRSVDLSRTMSEQCAVKVKAHRMI